MRHHTCLVLLALASTNSCEQQSSDDVQQRQQEAILKEGTSAVGMPNIKNFREKRLMKTILEMRDQKDLSTFTYAWSDYQGKFVFLCNSIGYAIPYATQFTNPQKIDIGAGSRYLVIPQADPNGLFSPASAEGSWIVCKDPESGEVGPLYSEQRLTVSPHKLSASIVMQEPVAPPSVTATPSTPPSAAAKK